MVNTPYRLVVIVVGAMIATLRILWKCIHHFATDLVDTYLNVIYNNFYTAWYTDCHYDDTEKRTFFRSVRSKKTYFFNNSIQY